MGAPSEKNMSFTWRKCSSRDSKKEITWQEQWASAHVPGVDCKWKLASDPYDRLVLTCRQQIMWKVLINGEDTSRSGVVASSSVSVWLTPTPLLVKIKPKIPFNKWALNVALFIHYLCFHLLLRATNDEFENQCFWFNPCFGGCQTLFWA